MENAAARQHKAEFADFEKKFKKKLQALSKTFGQGCKIFLYTIYQNGGNYTKVP
jgi:hypothetical protein